MEIINVTDEIIEINVTEAVVNVVTQNGAYPLPSNVFSVFGRTGNVVGQAGDYTTSIVAEGTNLYYTQARFNTAFGNKTTTDLAEGTNLYYTDARSRAAISENITGLEYSSASGIFSLANGYLIPTQAMLDAKVPYTGATGNVTLGEYQLSAGQVAFDQTPTGAAGVGVLRWNDNDGTLDLGLKGGNVTLQVGQEVVARVVNKTGADLLEANYQVVRISSAQGQRVAVQLAQANNDANSTDTIGIVTETIQNNQEGFITILGQVKEINTTGSLQGETWADGDVLYLSPTTAGRITNIKPTAPQHMVAVGYVEYAHSQHGKIYTKIQNGYELEELHDVSATPYIDKGVLYRDTATNLWKSATIGTLLGYTPVTSARTISTTAPLTGGGDLSADRTFAINQSSASTDGYLSSTDWSTFNNKQPLIAAGTTAQYYRGDKTFQTLNTTAVAEGTNLYYTDARARAAITGTAPIDVSGGVVSISQSGGAANGYLSSTDWNTFNNKQAALNGTGFVKISGTTISYDANTYLTTISGIAAGGELSGTYPNPTLVNSAVTGKVLSGVNITGGSIVDTDSILTAFGKLQNQVNSLVGGSIYKGTWNAATNTPTLTSGVGSKGFYYIVDVYGTTNLDGVAEWHVGDWAIFDGVKWQKVDTTDAVTSVNGEVGAVSLTTSNISEGTNLYFTNARAIGSTLTGYTSGAGVVAATDTILQAIQKLNGNVSGLVTGVSSVFGRTGAVVAASGDYNTSQVTENTNLYYTQGRFDTAFSGKSTTNLTEGTNLYYTEARVDANANVAANTAARHAAVTIGTANGLSLSTQALSLAAASTSTTGALTSTDWNTFNGKQAALNGTGFVKISGTTISYDNSTYLTTSSASATYLPLTGGTLTGALNGTSATFTSGLINGTTDAFFDLNRSASGNAGRVRFQTAGTDEFEIGLKGGVAGFHITKGDATELFTIASTGAATFSSSITANAASQINGLTQDAIQTIFTIQGYNASAQPKALYFQLTGSTPLFTIRTGATGTDAGIAIRPDGNNGLTIPYGTGAATFSGAVNSDGRFGAITNQTSPSDGSAYFYKSSAGAVVSGFQFIAETGGAGSRGTRLTIDNTGAATFSNSVTATTSLIATSADTLGTNINIINSSSGGYNWNIFSGGSSNTLGPVGSLIFRDSTNGATRMVISPSGNVGIGTSSPAFRFHVVGPTNGVAYISGSSNAYRAELALEGNGQFTGSFVANPSASSTYNGIPTSTVGITTSSTDFVIATSNTERLRITTGGILNFNGDSTETSTNDKFSMGFSNSNYGWLQTWSGRPLYLNRVGNAVYAGTQRIDNNSDQRIKENIVPIENALDVVLSLNGRKFNMLDENGKLRYGFVAQEVQPHLADFVTESDRTFEKNNIKIENLLTLESSGASWAAILVEAIKEQQAQIEELKAKILSL